MKAFQYRTDENTYNNIKKLAEIDRRSINQEIDYIIRLYISQRQIKGDFPITGENSPYDR